MGRPQGQTVMIGNEARRRAEIIQTLRETRGEDVVDLALWALPRVVDSIVLGKRDLVIVGVHPQQVDRLVACLGDLNFSAEEAPTEPSEMSGGHGKGLTRVVVRW